MLNAYELEKIQKEPYDATPSNIEEMSREVLLNRGVLILRGIQLRELKARLSVAEDIYNFTMTRAQRMVRNVKLAWAILVITFLILVFNGAFA